MKKKILFLLLILSLTFSTTGCQLEKNADSIIPVQMRENAQKQLIQEKTDRSAQFSWNGFGSTYPKQWHQQLKFEQMGQTMHVLVTNRSTSNVYMEEKILTFMAVRTDQLPSWQSDFDAQERAYELAFRTDKVTLLAYSHEESPFFNEQYIKQLMPISEESVLRHERITQIKQDFLTIVKSGIKNNAPTTTLERLQNFPPPEQIQSLIQQYAQLKGSLHRYNKNDTVIENKKTYFAFQEPIDRLDAFRQLADPILSRAQIETFLGEKDGNGNPMFIERNGKLYAQFLGVWFEENLFDKWDVISTDPNQNSFKVIFTTKVTAQNPIAAAFEPIELIYEASSWKINSPMIFFEGIRQMDQIN